MPTTTAAVLDPPTWCDSDFARAAWTAGSAAAPFADDVDVNARFPREGLAAMREAGLLGAMVPVEFGGGGATITEMSTAVRALAYHCSATALVMAMHQIEVWYLMRHGHTDELRSLLGRVATDGLLIANGNSEVGLGGDVNRSICAVERVGDRFTLQKDMLAVSYGAYADALLTTARRAPDAEGNDQVMVAMGPGSYKLTQTSTWDTTGLRGTCSCGFLMEGEESAGMIFPTPWTDIVKDAMGAFVVLLSSVWLGIAEAAAARAHAYVRADARRNIGTVPASAPPLAELVLSLTEARSNSAVTIAAFQEAHDSGAPDAFDSPVLLLALRNLKVSSTTLAIEVVTKASGVCGIAGYKRDTPFTMDRYLRDVMGGPLMANNSRFLALNAQLLLGMKRI